MLLGQDKILITESKEKQMQREQVDHRGGIQFYCFWIFKLKILDDYNSSLNFFDGHS